MCLLVFNVSVLMLVLKSVSAVALHPALCASDFVPQGCLAALAHVSYPRRDERWTSHLVGGAREAANPPAVHRAAPVDKLTPA